MSTTPTRTTGPSDNPSVAQVAEQRVVALRAVRSVLGVSPDEEDLVQEVLARLVARLREPGDIALGAWTWRVARNVAIDHVRARRATPTDPVLLDREAGDGLDDDVIAAGLAAAVQDGLSRLPVRQREALEAQAALDGGRGGHALVAAQLGVTPKAAESILARARQSLRRELGAWVAVGAFVGWTWRLVRRAVTPRSLVGRAVLLACAGAATAAVVIVAVPHWEPARGRAPSPAGRVAPHSPVPAGTATVSVTVPARVSLPAPAAVAITLPPVTVPSVTVPPLAVPSVTVPSLTAPSVTAPSVTAPSATAPLVTPTSLP